MNKKRLLITGGSGLLGVNWAITCRDFYDVVLLLNKRLINIRDTSSVIYQVTSYQMTLELFNMVKPDIVIHTAGLTNVELCESNPLLANSVNVKLSDFLSKVCGELGIDFVHISTDHLFSGENTLYNESEIVSPLNVYGKTKAKAEEIVKYNNQNALIVRTNFYCWGTSYRNSFSDVIINSLRNKDNIKLFDDVFYTPILAEYLIKFVHVLLEKKQKGVFNIVSSERITKYEFGILLATTFNLDNSFISRAKITDNFKLVKRPADMSLSNKKLEEIIGIEIPTINIQMRRLFEQEQNGIRKEILSI
ncbi:MAG: SDR family oxidoreductase [Chitinophagaceae bacterium]|nr:SDR family oxidoreductase [Chitinophagaceae bacterium]